MQSGITRTLLNVLLLKRREGNSETASDNHFLDGTGIREGKSHFTTFMCRENRLHYKS